MLTLSSSRSCYDIQCNRHWSLVWGQWKQPRCCHCYCCITHAKSCAVFFDNGNIIGFWILDLSNNTVQGPCRALLVDIAPADQQSLGSSFFSVMLGIPYCVHSVVTAIYRYWKSNRLFYWPFATYQVHALLWYRRTRPF